jgi:hypothetical protein
MAPLGGVERPRRKVRFARLIHAARPRSWRTCGPRRLRRQFESDLAATQGGSARAAPHCRTLRSAWCGRGVPAGGRIAGGLPERRPNAASPAGRWRARRHQRDVTPGNLRPAARVPRSTRSQPSRGRPQRPPVAARSERESPSLTGLAARSPSAAQRLVLSYSVLRDR